ncbi:RNA exonuclease [Taphrina deformans PYCC 5710]|uniref:RNA exonuclease 4 n=1 Tax=Taphrina deformans (strain PYCC 5710 / ATCC 11124 / CBS 356.35 / IMI 108563 / JCM 9778 / NBRC 8474) TaxID=1097556 RepID=R4X7C4_TAPDE|nr:RNA exonuclease [Taphrina deformans PYCC 5710]|eukprot:CCG81221.1 RNA exonuclease [Taphrina deformans PYCC 5710]
MAPDKKRKRDDAEKTTIKSTRKSKRSRPAGSLHTNGSAPDAAKVTAPETIVAPLEVMVSDTKSSKIGKYLALDCEMVGTNAPPIGPREHSTLARISITNYHGHVIYDSYVAPPTGHKITDYRTWVSGIEPHHLYQAPTFEHVQDHVKSLLKGRVLVGHALVNDFRALQFTHPKHMVRDTSTFPKFKDYSVGRTPGLKKVALMELGINIQGAQHSSIEDARACMAIYRKYKAEFEQRATQKALGN